MNFRQWFLCCCLLFASTALWADPIITGKVTHKITAPSNNSTFYDDESFNVSWTYTSSTWNINYRYFMLYHTYNGSGQILRPGASTTYSISNFGVGTHTFKVRAVQVIDGTAYYGSYSSPITVNIQERPNPVVGQVTHNVNSMSNQFDNYSLNVSWTPRSGFSGLSYQQYQIEHVGHGSSTTTSTSKSYSGLAAEQNHCFRVRAKHDGQWGNYSSNQCLYVYYNIQGEVTHNVSVSGSSVATGGSKTFTWNETAAIYDQIPNDHFVVGHQIQDADGVIGNTEYSEFNVNASSTSRTLSNLRTGRHCLRIKLKSRGRWGLFSGYQCFNVTDQADNLFKNGIVDTATGCFPSGMAQNWRREAFVAKNNQYNSNGHILGINRSRLNLHGATGDYTVSGCTKANHDNTTDPVRVSAAAKAQLDGLSSTDSVLYFKTHSCTSAVNDEACIKDHRAEISYDMKKHPYPTYADGQKHAQEGDTFWVAYSFNPVSLFATDPNDADGDGRNFDFDPNGPEPYVHISQFHPETLSYSARCKKGECSLTKGHAPTFAMLLYPVWIDSNTVSTTQARLKFSTRYYPTESSYAFQTLGEIKTINLNEWQQIKIGLKFSATDGWVMAAHRVGKSTTGAWDYFKHPSSPPSAVGTRFTGQTLHAAYCLTAGPVGSDCATDTGRIDTTFKAGAYFHNLWQGQVDKHYEILMDDFFLSERNDHRTYNIWAAPYSTNSPKVYEANGVFSGSYFHEIDLQPTARQQVEYRP